MAKFILSKIYQVSSKRLGKILGGLFSVCFGVMLVAIMIYEPVVTENKDEYIRLHVTLSAPPEISRQARHPSERIFSFKEYPGIYFGVEMQYCLGDIDSINTGDTANVMVLKEEYSRTIKREANFFERMIFSRPNLYGYIKDGKNYINLHAIVADRLNPFLVYPLLTLIAIIFIFNGIMTFFIKE